LEHRAADEMLIPQRPTREELPGQEADDQAKSFSDQPCGSEVKHRNGGRHQHQVEEQRQRGEDAQVRGRESEQRNRAPQPCPR
jgi:hypothetical protein